MNTVFSAIQQSKVSEDIVQQIKDLIINGKLKPGEKLPSERKLSEILKVGRSSLREAINSLSMMGLVEVKKRQGIYISNISAPLVIDPLKELLTDDLRTINHLYDIRIDIEVATARAAALNRSESDLDDIRRCLEKMKDHQGTSLYSIEDDLELHIAIAHATGNYLRVHIIKNIFELTEIYIHKALLNIIEDQANIEVLFKQHERICEAIGTREGSQAADAMQHHLQWVKSQLNEHL